MKRITCIDAEGRAVRGGDIVFGQADIFQIAGVQLSQGAGI